MKSTLIISLLIITGMVCGLQAQTSSILIKSGDRINGTSSNAAKLLTIANLTMNESGGIAFLGNAIETNTVTNSVTQTNTSVTFQYTNVLTTTVTNQYSGIITNIISYTNVWNVNGVIYTYVHQSPQIKYSTNGSPLNSYISTLYTPQGGHNVTNSSIITNKTLTTTSMQYNGIWVSSTNGQFNLVARSGQNLGGGTNPVNYFTEPVLNNNGATAFIGYSYATNGFTTNTFDTTNSLSGGIYKTITTNPVLVQTNLSIYLNIPGAGSTNTYSLASVGKPAPGTSSSFTSFNTLALPDVGGVIFVGTAGTNQGIWVQNPDTTLHLVALRGQTVTVGNTNKVLSSFSLMNAPSPGVTRSFSEDTGNLIYQAYFTDGSSAAVQVSR